MTSERGSAGRWPRNVVPPGRSLPGVPDGKVPVPSTCRSPSNPCPAMARAASSTPAGSPARGATEISSTIPEATGGDGRGGRASAMSIAAITNPSAIQSRSISPSPPGSHTTPDGTPYITAERRSSPPLGQIRAIHGPGHENAAASAIRAIPSPKPPSQRDTVHPVAGSSPAAGTGSCSNGSSRIVARQARNDAVSIDSSHFGSRTSLMPGSYEPGAARGSSLGGASALLLRRRHGSGHGAAALLARQAEAEVRSPAPTKLDAIGRSWDQLSQSAESCLLPLAPSGGRGPGCRTHRTCST